MMFKGIKCNFGIISKNGNKDPCIVKTELY